MKKSLLIGVLAIPVIGSLIVAGIILVDLGEDEALVGKLYTFPISVEEKTYIITVRTN